MICPLTTSGLALNRGAIPGEPRRHFLLFLFVRFTTAASIWVTAALGVLCGLAAWKLLVVAVAGALFLLLAGGSIEKWCQKIPGIVEKADLPDFR